MDALYPERTRAQLSLRKYFLQGKSMPVKLKQLHVGTELVQTLR